MFIKNNEFKFPICTYFVAKFLDYPAFHIDDAPVELRRDDIFLGLDLHHGGILNSEIFTLMRHIGIRIYFVIYDMFPVVLSNFFPEGLAEAHKAWLSAVSERSDGVIAISRTIADEFAEWLNETFPGG